jgi:hypothetical protein
MSGSHLCIPRKETVQRPYFQNRIIMFCLPIPALCHQSAQHSDVNTHIILAGCNKYNQRVLYPLVLLNFSECPIFVMDETKVHVIPASGVPWRYHLRLAALGKNGQTLIPRLFSVSVFTICTVRPCSCIAVFML